MNTGTRILVTPPINAVKVSTKINFGSKGRMHGFEITKITSISHEGRVKCTLPTIPPPRTLLVVPVSFLHTSTIQTSPAVVIQSEWRAERSRMKTSLPPRGRNPSMPSDLRRVVYTKMTVYGVLTPWEKLTRDITFKSSFQVDTTFVQLLLRVHLCMIQTGWQNIDFNTPWTGRTSRFTPKMGRSR